MSRFYFGSGPGSNSSDDEDNLPYPEALPRRDFLALHFDAPTYLSTLSERHQTLEDLRTDLRERSQALSKELLDLVNTNYEQFLSLGSDLEGGEVKVEDVRVGLLSFKRGVEDVRGKVKQRRTDVEGLLAEKMGVSKQIALGRKLLEFDARLEEVEDKLMVSSLGHGANELEQDLWSDSEDEEGSDEGLQSDTRTGCEKLQRLATDCKCLEQLVESIGKDHPFVVAQNSRMVRVKNTILLDLGTTLKQTAKAGEKGRGRLVKILGIYRGLSADGEAVKVLRDLQLKNSASA